MRQSSTVEPPSFAAQALPMGLQQALAHLDIQIEEELVRYRRQRRQSGSMSPSHASSQSQSAVALRPAAKTLDLIAIPALGGRTNPLPSESPIAAPGGEIGGSAALPALEGAIGPMEESSRPVESYSIQAHSAPNGMPISSGAITTGGRTEGQMDSAPTDPTHLDDYLESSEALLQSLAVEEAQVRAEKGFMKSLVTPLGIGSMLLLLLSSSLFGYVLMNPGTLTELLAFRQGHPPQSTANNSQPQTSSPSALSPLEPNLAAQEFKDLNINTLGSLKLNGSALRSPALPSPLPTPTGKPLGVAVRVGADGKVVSPVPGNVPVRGSQMPFGPAVVIPSQPRAVYAPPAVTVYSPPQPARRPASTAPKSAPRSVPATPRMPQPIVEVAPAPSPSSSAAASAPVRRTVVVPYSNDRDLDAAQRVDPAAHMDSSFNDGITRINAGTYGDEAAAKARVIELQRQGVNAEIREER
jgi:hypothetical protein